jgi:hypothetical protein
LTQELNQCQKLRVPVFGLLLFLSSNGVCLEPVDKILKLQTDFHKDGLSFWVHVTLAADVAFLFSATSKINAEEESNAEDDNGGVRPITRENSWENQITTKRVRDCMTALRKTNSVTLNPHLHPKRVSRIVLSHEASLPVWRHINTTEANKRLSGEVSEDSDSEEDEALMTETIDEDSESTTVDAVGKSV